MPVDQETFMGFMNLHDAFLNASIQRSYMLKSPITTDPNEFHISDRGRFERTWIAFLYVLVEAWQAKRMSPIRSFVASITSSKELEDLLRSAKRDGTIKEMKAVRHYMCHRDKREYWDAGRSALVGQLHVYDSLHMAFSDVLSAVFRKLEASKPK